MTDVTASKLNQTSSLEPSGGEGARDERE